LAQEIRIYKNFGKKGADCGTLLPDIRQKYHAHLHVVGIKGSKFWEESAG